MSIPSLSNTPFWEKVVGLVGVVLILATIGFLFWSALDENGTPPNIQAKVRSISLVPSGYLVQVTVDNSGSQTAKNLDMEARLTVPDGKSEQATVTIDYLASQSSQDVGFYFTLNPSSGELVFRPLGFQIP